MRKLITFSLFLASTSFLGAQTTTDDYYKPAKPKFLSKDKVSGSISVGTGLSVSNNQTTALTTYIAPKIGYQVSERFKLNVGLMHYSVAGNTFMPVNQNEAFINSSNKTQTGNLLFVEGQYQLNKRVVVSGAVMYDANNISNNKNNYKAVELGLDYKVSKHSSIGVKAVISQGDSPYYNSHNGMYNFGGQNPMMFDSFGGLGNDLTHRLNSSIR